MYLTPACAICSTDTRALHARDVDADILTDTILQRHTDIRYRDIQTYAIVAYPVTWSKTEKNSLPKHNTGSKTARAIED